VSLSEGGAVCTNIARTDLCGGCWVTSIPTATPSLRAKDEGPKIANKNFTMY